MLLTQPRPCSLVAGSVRCLQIPIHVPFAISRETLHDAQIVLIELRDAHGLKGLGECAPFPSLTGDTKAVAASMALQLVEEIRGLTVVQAMQRLRAMKAEVTKQSITAYVGLEGALWDLYARQQGVSLAQLWGRADREYLDTDITLPLMKPTDVAGFWDLYGPHAFPIIKVKVSGRVDDDLALIHALRDLIPDRVRLSLDGNQGFTVDQALKLVGRLAASGCQPLFFEQPLPADDTLGQIRLQAQSPIPLCADETVKTKEDAQRVIDQKMAGMINIKIMKSGIEESLAIIDLASRAKLPLMIGGMLESEVAMGLSLQIACSTGAIQHIDLDTPFFFKQRVTTASPWHQTSARLRLPEGPGHGLTAI